MILKTLLLAALLLPQYGHGFIMGPDKRNMDIYLLIGQSNMSGRAEIEDKYQDTLPGVYLLTNDTLNLWEPAANPLNKYSSIGKKIEMQKLGPGYSFAKHMRAYHPGKEIGLVVNARGGTSIRKWKPGSIYYNEAVMRTKAAMEYGSLKGILWLQGEADISRTDVYLDSLVHMITALREEFSNLDLPFIAGELSEDREKRIAFNEMLRALPDRLEFTAVISSKGTSTIDSTHFDSRSQEVLGERFSTQMIEMLNKE